MTAEKPTPMVPNLRFPEFSRAGDWHFQPLSDIAEPISERVGMRKCVPMSVTTGVGLVSQQEKFGRTIAGNSYKNYIRLQTNDFAYNKSATKEFPQGYIARYSGTKGAAVPNSIFTCFRPEIAAVIPEYLEHLFHRNHHGQWLRKYITIGARAHGALSVSDNDLMSMPVPLPPDAVSCAEQQKIADCLGSLDGLIVAEGRKLKALRQHKQGLMQQLLPQPGETQPVLRFPEFHNSANWQEGPLSHLLTFQNGYPFSSKYFGEERQGPRLIRNRDLRSEDRVVYYEGHPRPEFIVNDGDLLVGMDGDFTPCVWHKGTGLLNQRVGRILPRGKHVLRFLGHLLEIQLKAVQDDTARTTVKHLSSRTVEGMIVHVPNPDEQLRIADCLSSLDDLIAAEGRMVDALRHHKQGLMQQLFPSLAVESQ